MQWSPRSLAGLNVTLGILHLVRPKGFDALIPRWVPGSPRFWTLASGVVEVGTAALLVNPATRRLGGAASTVLYAAVWPANVQMAIDWKDRPLPARAIAWARVPMQIPLLRAAASVAAGR